MHVGTIFAPIVAPLLVWCLSKSPFVRAHARRSLTETLVVQGVLLVAGAISLTYSLWSLYQHYQNDWKDFSIWPILVKAAVGWIIVAVLEVVNTIQALRMAAKAYKGEIR